MFIEYNIIIHYWRILSMIENKGLINYSLVDFAYNALKRDIVTEHLTPGQKLVVRELCERYGVSETPIKQALNRLLTEGLIEVVIRKGMRVKQIRFEEIEDLLETRYMIEIFCVKHALLAIGENDVIRQSFNDNIENHRLIVQSAIDISNYFRNYQIDQEFHQIFVNCSGNNKIIEIYKNLGTHILMFYSIYYKQSWDRLKEGFIEHERIYNALICQDEKLLIQSIDTHILNGKKDIKLTIDKQNKT